MIYARSAARRIGRSQSSGFFKEQPFKSEILKIPYISEIADAEAGVGTGRMECPRIRPKEYILGISAE